MMRTVCNRRSGATPLIAILLIATIPATVLSFSNQYIAPLSDSVSIFRQRHLRTSVQLYARDGAMARRKRGFAKEDESESSKASDPIYSLPPLYDLAFGYRSYSDEVDFLIGIHNKYAKCTTSEPLRIIELAAGPARHSLMALSEHSREKVQSAVALDRSQDMVNYGCENADFELGSAGGRRDDFTYVCGDMRNITEAVNRIGFRKNFNFDAAWLLLGSMQHLLTNDDTIACFQSINSSLRPGGTVVIELPHPRETFSMGECTKNGWKVPLTDEVDDDGNEKEYGELSMVWGDEDDEFDPIAQVRQFTVSMELSVKNSAGIPQDLNTSPLFRQMTNDGKTKLKDVVPMRLFTLQELDALARCAGLELVAKYGALDDISIEDEDEAFRMVCVLRKTK